MSAVGEWVGRFRLQRPLGAGGMATVWLGMHAVTNKLVAVKILRPQLAKNRESRERFLREARAAATVRHVNVVDVHDILELEDGTPAIIMEYLEGESLEARLSHQKAFFLHDLVALMSPVCAALAAAHAAGIVHRDLKPGNIFLARNIPGSGHTGPLVKVLDFGLAIIANDSTRSTRPGAMLGTPAYMAPEQIVGDRNIDHRADIWSLGVILYECLAGEPPIAPTNAADMFRAMYNSAITPLDSVRQDLPADIVDLVRATLSFRREARPATARDVLVVLERHRRGTGDAEADSTVRSELPPFLLEKLTRK